MDLDLEHHVVVLFPKVKISGESFEYIVLITILFEFICHCDLKTSYCLYSKYCNLPVILSSLM